MIKKITKKRLDRISNSLIRQASVWKFILFFLLINNCSLAQVNQKHSDDFGRERISINEDWHFYKYKTIAEADKLIYDERPEVVNVVKETIGDLTPTEADSVHATMQVLKSYILPTANKFIKDTANWHKRPKGNPGENFDFVKSDFDDSSWDKINLPHDWAINGPFLQGWDAEVQGGMGRLPSHGVAWYRKKLNIPVQDIGKLVILEIDGAMSYAIVWLNGHLIGGWPYGYASWQLDLTPYINFGEDNQLAIRLDNPNNSSRWYPGGGIYRNVWLTKVNPVHVGQWGTKITTNNVSNSSAEINLTVTIDNDAEEQAQITVQTDIYELDEQANKTGEKVAGFSPGETTVVPHGNVELNSTLTLENPKLWGPKPTQVPNLYVAVTSVFQNGRTIDQYETRFGIRSIEFDADRGIIVNGEHIPLQGANQHHDLGALGAAFNTRAAERQLENLQDMGCNAIRMSHNPPAPELLELTDKMGFLVIDEIFDSWERKKTPLDFHLIFTDWHEADIRAFIRRDRNCPSIFLWSFGNEVGEQYTGKEGAALAEKLKNICFEEDPTRLSMSAINFAKPHMELPKVFDVVTLNYQGEGIRQDTTFAGITNRIRTKPQYDAFRKMFPNKVIISTETAYAISSRGDYLFPVCKPLESKPLRDGQGGDSKNFKVSAYEVHGVDYGSSVDKVFKSLDKHPYVAGEFVWTGWDYIGEPEPYYLLKSSFSGSFDLAGFKKDRYYLYQSRWKPDNPMTHILPHWNWPERVGKITPVHVFTSGDEAELFLNGQSLGKRKKGLYEYRLQWDSVIYQPGELKVVAYKEDKKWAEDLVKTTGKASRLNAQADRSTIKADGYDLSFITIKVTDEEGLMIPNAMDEITFSIDGPGEIVATDNGDQSCMVPFNSTVREAYNGLCLAIIRSKNGMPGEISITAKSTHLKQATVKIVSK